MKLLLQRRWTPRWLRTFVEEPVEEHEELGLGRKQALSRLSLSLLLVSIAGCMLQILTVFYPDVRMQMVYPAVSWAFACLFIAIGHPVSTPKSLLVLYFGISVSQLILLVDGTSVLRYVDIPTTVALFMSFGAILIIMNMPLRDPNLSREKISPAFGPSTSELRTPEDNLTLWQFMSVSWMSPLISLGIARQLNDADVWDLGYEFKHRMLHDRFRELRGTVLRRLLVANGIDLALISLLAILELVASKHVCISTTQDTANTCARFFRACTFAKDPTEYGGSPGP